jgi:hypothetical protein
VPARIAGSGRDAGVKAHLSDLPSLGYVRLRTNESSSPRGKGLERAGIFKYTRRT